MIEKRLYERLGGVFAIAAVVDHFSDNRGTRPGRVVSRPTRPARSARSSVGVGTLSTHEG
jgi:hypothetical protein